MGVGHVAFSIRLPVLAIVRLKCVCKTWLHLLDSPEFANLHLSKTSPGILVHQQQWDSSLFDFSGFEDELGDQVQCHELHCVPVAKFDIIKIFHGFPTIVGSVDGFLCLRSRRPFDDLYIFNLIKREYISLPAPQRETAFPFTVSHGFGVSTNGGQYKLVLIFQESEPTGIPSCDSHVYTLGTTGKWRCIAPISITPLNYCCYSIGASLNGNLHWLAADVDYCNVGELATRGEI
ncbi:F-box protein At1g53790-like [Henckelia pumila]|uniref:F-box protein At1g53790-like n=1 Tax=Henckelia pumila TaxID=405737 RepID=UPI003C6E1FDA